MDLRWLFETHHRPLLRLLCLRGVAPHEAEDLAADVWIAVERRLPQEVTSLGTIDDPIELRRRTSLWVSEFGRRRALRYFRDRARRKLILGESPLLDAPDDRGDAGASDDPVARLRAVLDAMTDAAQRALLEEVFVRGTTQIDAARARGWSEPRLRRALQKAIESAKRTARRRFPDGCAARRKQGARVGVA